MLSLPVPLVLAGAPAQPVLDALAAERIPCYRATAAEAAGAVSAGWAQLVVVSRFPGWSELAGRLEASGAAVVVLDAAGPLGASRATPAPGMDVAATPEALPAALWRAEARRAARSAAPAADESLLERLQNAERVSRFAQAIATQLTLPDVVGEAIARTCELCEADGAALLRVDAETGELVFEEVSGGSGERLARVRLAPGDGVAGRVAQSATPVLVRDAASHPHVRQGVGGGEFRTRSLIAVPLLLGGDVLGVLEAVRGEGRPPFDERHLQRLQRLAPHVTIAVHNAQLTDSLRRSQTEVLAANGQLEQRVRERTAQIARAKQEWEQTFDAISEPIALLDGFVIRRANQAYARAARRPVHELPGRRCHEVLAGRDTPCPGCPLQGRAPGSGEVEMPARGATFAVHGFGLRTGEAGAGTGAVVVHYRDVTAERRLEAQLRESERMAGLGQLASGAAHEINNPLGFVMANLRSLGGLLEDLQAELDAAGRPAAGGGLAVRALARDGRGMVQESLTGAQRVAAIVKGLRELSRQQIARVELTGVEGSVRRAVREAFGAAAADVRLQLGAAGRVRMSPLQLDQALVHVLRNARQAVQPGQEVAVTTADEAGAVVIEVRDAGCGIAPEHLRRVFEPFFTTRGIGGGVGLGLTAAYGTVQRHGGSIDLQSTVGQGTTVRIRLPAVSEAESQAADAAHAA